MIQRILFLAISALSLCACASDPQKQWYKPAGNYSVADFSRDQASCTKNRVLDEECLKERGWAPLSADETKLPPPPDHTRRGRY